MIAAPNSFNPTQSSRYPPTYTNSAIPSDRPNIHYSQPQPQGSWDARQLAQPNEQFVQPSAPTIRVTQQSASPNLLSSAPPAQRQNFLNADAARSGWSYMDKSGNFGPALQKGLMRGNIHQRGPSNTSNESRSSVASYSQPQYHGPGYTTANFDSAGFGLSSAAADYPTPAYHYPRADILASDDVPPLSPANRMAHNSRLSVSSDFQAPLTPRTHNDDGEIQHDISTDYKKPFMNESVDDFYPASNFNPNLASRSLARTQQHNGLLSPGKTSIDGYIHAANERHSKPTQHSPRVFDASSPYQQNLNVSTPNTISPKDTLLEIDDDDTQTSLFPSQGSDLGFGLADSRRPSSSFSMASNYNSVPATSGASLLNKYPFVPRNERLTPSHMDFAANTLLRLDTASSGYSDISKPTSVRNDGGTYTCTYHGCTLRFETPQKLQKHKREGHRQTGIGAPSGELTPGGSIRDSQAGPHKCTRINPTTGKPCNTIFSRPYDLTRHEDTIHNIKKVKARCAYCTEEKTFSRNDALTRHMRVVHPDIEFSAKSRRKNAVN